MLKYQIIPVTPFQQNCSLLWCEESRKGAVIDPGGDLPLITSAIKANNIELESILLTHGHLDHASGTADLAKHLSIPIIGPHKEDAFWIDALPQVTAQYGFPIAQSFTPDRWLNNNDTVTVGQYELNVFHCPGHTPGHVIFYSKDIDTAWVGDVLFKGSIGRTDFPKGDYDTLIASIKNQLWPLGDTVEFVPGHGPKSTFGFEKANNPFVKDDSPYR